MKILSTVTKSVGEILSKIRRKQSKSEDAETIVKPILKAVEKEGDRAVRRFNKKFDGLSLDNFQVTPKEIKEAYKNVSPDLINALKAAKRNIECFHRQNITWRESATQTQSGVSVWREFRPIEKVGLYVPGGLAAYPSTVLMLAVPAKVAGCKEMIMCTPASRDGICNPAVLVAADLCGVKKIYKVGGAQAIAAMAYGTETIPKVYKIFGPGNQFVTTAKMLVYGQVDIDMPAGPSEVLVVTDKTANPKWVAADLLSQLEHGTDSQAILVTFDSKVAVKIIEEMKRQTKALNRKEIIKESFRRSFAIIVQSTDEAVQLIDEYAPEHLEIVCRHEKEILKKINNSGSVFLGKYTSEPLGDYATGANHTLPTSGFAKMFSALSANSFGKMMQIQCVSKKGLASLRKTVEILAENEGLDAHKNAITIRFK